MTAAENYEPGAQVVLMCGISGSGKTEYSKALERRGYVRVSSDALSWRLHGGDFTSLPWAEQLELFMAANAEVDAELRRLVGEGKKVVVDSTLCKRKRRDRLRAICAEMGADCELVYLSGDYETLHERLSARRGSGPDDIIITDTQLAGFCSGFETPAPDEPLTRL